MNREEHLQNILGLAKTNPNLILQIATGVGKTKIAIELIKQWQCKKILIVIPKLVLEQNWLDEFNKWELNIEELDIKFTTYVPTSFGRNVGDWDLILFDEMHHYTERVNEEMYKGFRWRYSLGLSATIKKDCLARYSYTFNNPLLYKVTLKEAIKDKILPDPKVILIPLTLDPVHIDEKFYIHDTGRYAQLKEIKECIKIPYDTFLIDKATRDYHNWYEVSCTQKNKYTYISNRIESLKNQGKEYYKILANERLELLASWKTDTIRQILRKLKDKKTITFCKTIDQAEQLSDNAITSKNIASKDILEAFNKNKIKHISSVDMLNEGVNLKSCQIGIWARLSASDRIQKQSIGRMLRHKNPICIVPYFVETRDEEIVNDLIINNYNPELIQNLSLEQFLKTKI